jgi:hypothetical protein
MAELNLKEVKAHRYQANGRGIHTVEYTHIPTGIFVVGADSNIPRLRARLLAELAGKVTR